MDGEPLNEQEQKRLKKEQLASHRSSPKGGQAPTLGGPDWTVGTGNTLLPSTNKPDLPPGAHGPRQGRPPGAAIRPFQQNRPEPENQFTWLTRVPPTLRERLIYKESTDYKLPKGDFVVLLYAGRDDPSALDKALHSIWPQATSQVISFDILRSKSNHNLLATEPWNSLCTAALEGRIAAVVGGPNCKSWSIRRWIRKPKNEPQAYPVRGRSEQEVWGYPDLANYIKEMVDDDSVLLLRQIYLTSLAKRARQRLRKPTCYTLLEHPADPKIYSKHKDAGKCSSIWATSVIQAWLYEHDLRTIDFDQCRLGQVVPKTTTVATDLDLHWEGKFCNHASHDSTVEDSSELSRWPWQMMLDIATAIHRALNNHLI